MPVRVSTGDGELRWLRPSQEWQETALPSPPPAALEVDENFYVEARSVTGVAGS
jgi:hypothetical protein